MLWAEGGPGGGKAPPGVRRRRFFRAQAAEITGFVLGFPPNRTGIGLGHLGVHIFETYGRNLGFEVSETWLTGRPRKLSFEIPAT